MPIARHSLPGPLVRSDRRATRGAPARASDRCPRAARRRARAPRSVSSVACDGVEAPVHAVDEIHVRDARWRRRGAGARGEAGGGVTGGIVLGRGMPRSRRSDRARCPRACVHSKHRAEELARDELRGAIVEMRRRAARRRRERRAARAASSGHASARAVCLPRPAASLRPTAPSSPRRSRRCLVLAAGRRLGALPRHFRGVPRRPRFLAPTRRAARLGAVSAPVALPAPARGRLAPARARACGRTPTRGRRRRRCASSSGAAHRTSTATARAADAARTHAARRGARCLAGTAAPWQRPSSRAVPATDSASAARATSKSSPRRRRSMMSLSCASLRMRGNIAIAEALAVATEELARLGAHVARAHGVSSPVVSAATARRTRSNASSRVRRSPLAPIWSPAATASTGDGGLALGRVHVADGGKLGAGCFGSRGHRDPRTILAIATATATTTATPASAFALRLSMCRRRGRSSTARLGALGGTRLGEHRAERKSDLELSVLELGERQQSALRGFLARSARTSTCRDSSRRTSCRSAASPA